MTAQEWQRVRQPDDTVVTFTAVSKRFDQTVALDAVSLALPRGSVIGLIGRNGAGKSTLIRCLLGLERPSTGQIRVFGEDPMQLSIAAKQRLGVMLDGGVPFASATPDQLFDFSAPLYPRWDHRLEAALRARFRIKGGEPLGATSLGQQPAVALALCPRPDLLVLDEPAANLDPVLRQEFLSEVLGLVAETGRTVVFSSHNLGDVERVADHIALLHDGRLLLHRPTEDLRERVRQLRFIFPHEAPATIPLSGALAQRRSGRELLLMVDGFDEADLAGLTQTTGAHIEVARVGLEQLFVALAGGDAADRPEALDRR